MWRCGGLEMRRIKMKEKVKEWIVGGAFLWTVFWAMAVDSPEGAGLLAGGIALLGVMVLGVMLIKEWSEENGKRL